MLVRDSEDFATVLSMPGFTMVESPLPDDQKTKLLEWIGASHTLGNYGISIADSFEYTMESSKGATFKSRIVDFHIGHWSRLDPNVDWSAPALIPYVPEGIELEAFKHIAAARLRFEYDYFDQWAAPIGVDDITILGVVKNQGGHLVGDEPIKYNIYYQVRPELMIADGWDAADNFDNPEPEEDDLVTQWFVVASGTVDTDDRDFDRVKEKLSKAS